VSRSSNELIFAVHLAEPLGADVIAKAWAFGYRADTPFGEMPKLYLVFDEEGYRVFDGTQSLPADSVTVAATPLSSEVRIPLALLGKPERIMVSGQTALGEVPLDNIPWVFFDLIP
jgi:hypothetical protein